MISLSDFSLQVALAQIAIALSVFSLMTYLWLGLTVLLLGNRRSAVTWTGGLGLLMAALFFLCHGALVGAGVPPGAAPTDFWWRLAWLPGFAAPLLWVATGLHYTNLTGMMQRWRTPALIAVAAIGCLSALLVWINWPAINHYGDFIRLLGLALRLGPQSETITISPALPALGLSFVLYMTVCACLPWLALVARLRPATVMNVLRPALTHSETPEHASTASTNNDVSNPEAALLWDATDAWERARPALLLASLCMMCAGVVVALVGIASSLAENRLLRNEVPNALPIDLPESLPGHVPLILVAADVVVQFAMTALVLLIGWSVVRQGVLIERRLPQRGFLNHWRGVVLVALVLATVVAGMAALDPEALTDFLLLTALVTMAYALFSRQQYSEHDRLLGQLRPFITSLAAGHTSWLTPEPAEVERSVEALFTSLCRDVLDASHGQLSLTAGRLRRNFTYTSPDGLTGGREWVLPVMDERGVVARLALGPRNDGAGYTSADLEVARACGQRILDAVGEFAATQAIVSLARRRGLEAELSAALPRRVLHDDVLPRLHLAMLQLEALRSKVRAPTPTVASLAVVPGTRASSDMRELTAIASAEVEAGDELSAVVQDLGRAHHDLAALMRAAPAANPRRLEHGLVAVLRSSLEGEFRGTFDAVEWSAAEDACLSADSLPPIVADVLLGAALEAIRNAGRHARGGELHRRLKLRVELDADPQWVTIRVADDGVGMQSQSEAARAGQKQGAVTTTEQPVAADSAPALPAIGNGGTRTGLLAHGALVALVGGSLAVRSQPGPGTTVQIRVPRDAGLLA